MSAKSRFLKKLQARQSASVPPVNKSQADIAEFRLRMTQLQEQMDAWLEGTGLCVKTFSASVTDLLVESGAFKITGIVLQCNDRSITFTPLFLYGQGVTGCVEATCHTEGHVTSLGRLFMRASTVSDWCFTPPGAVSRPERIVDENLFFELIIALLA